MFTEAILAQMPRIFAPHLLISYIIQHFFGIGRHIYIIIWTIFVIFLDYPCCLGYNFLQSKKLCTVFGNYA